MALGSAKLTFNTGCSPAVHWLPHQCSLNLALCIRAQPNVSHTVVMRRTKLSDVYRVVSPGNAQEGSVGLSGAEGQYCPLQVLQGPMPWQAWESLCELGQLALPTCNLPKNSELLFGS